MLLAGPNQLLLDNYPSTGNTDKRVLLRVILLFLIPQVKLYVIMEEYITSASENAEAFPAVVWVFGRLGRLELVPTTYIKVSSNITYRIKKTYLSQLNSSKQSPESSEAFLVLFFCHQKRYPSW